MVRRRRCHLLYAKHEIRAIFPNVISGRRAAAKRDAGAIPMPILALFRHAKAAAPLHGQQDFDRPLTARGRDDARGMGEVLAQFPIDQAIVSAARRTCETWEIARAAFRPEPPASIEPGLYLCRPGVLIDRIRAIPDACQGAVLIGHNPCWHEAALWMAGGCDLEPMRRKFPTAALAVFTLTGPWVSVAPAAAKLECFATPDMKG
jgi:phosphohistidine phosphatase